MDNTANNNSLNALNDVLFETLRGVKDGSIDDKKAQTITNVSNSIISNAKTQLNAYKLTKGVAFQETFGKAPRTTIESADVYEQKSEFAIFKGFKNIPEAMGEMGNAKFENEFKKWINNN